MRNHNGNEHEWKAASSKWYVCWRQPTNQGKPHKWNIRFRIKTPCIQYQGKCHIVTIVVIHSKMRERKILIGDKSNQSEFDTSMLCYGDSDDVKCCRVATHALCEWWYSRHGMLHREELLLEGIDWRRDVDTSMAVCLNISLHSKISDHNRNQEIHRVGPNVPSRILPSTREHRSHIDPWWRPLASRIISDTSCTVVCARENDGIPQWAAREKRSSSGERGTKVIGRIRFICR